MHKGDAITEPDNTEDERLLSYEWPSDNGASIDIKIVAASWDAALIYDLKARGPAMLDLIAVRLSLDPQRVSVFLCNDEDMRAINKIHRGVYKATNVLSFPADHDLQRAGDMPADEVTIGDIAIAAETVMREASETGIAAGDHLLHLFTHGMLHLLGYDHEEDSPAAEMEGLEIDLLAQLNISNPYHGDHLGFGMREID
ncbi:MAG TPA: rRNA maturation RNase YbeY [Acidimicrobiaceae bacterium]|nr:rRNA maturation RNase YbeY [Acidimicrobiaceae bacterium]